MSIEPIHIKQAKEAMARKEAYCKANLNEDCIGCGWATIRFYVIALQAELATHRWIPVGERLPEKSLPNGLSKRVWCYNSKLQETWEGRYSHKKNKWLRDFPVPTHWKPIILPEGDLTDETK